MISLKQIRYALAVAKHLHFRKAAEECSISQSALSTALSEMEKLLGFAVFERDNKKVLVTPVGAQFLEKARGLQLQVDDLMSLADAQRGELSFPMKIGMIPTICPYLLPLVLPKLTEQYLEFCQEDLFWISHKDDITSTNEVVTTKELENAKLILLRDGHCLKDHALSACQLNSEQAKSLNATSLTTLIQLVLGRFGSTLIPELALTQLVKANPSLSVKRLAEPGPHRRLAFIVRPNYTNLKNIDALIAIFKSQLKLDKQP